MIDALTSASREFKSATSAIFIMLALRRLSAAAAASATTAASTATVVRAPLSHHARLACYRARRSFAVAASTVVRARGARGRGAGSGGRSVEETYQRKTPIEHVLLRPGMYVGSDKPDAAMEWVWHAKSKGLRRAEVKRTAALIKVRVWLRCVTVAWKRARLT